MTAFSWGYVTGGIVMFACLTWSGAVGDRAPSPSPGVPHATATPVLDSEAAPARPLPEWSADVGEDGGWQSAQDAGRSGSSSAPAAGDEAAAPASTVVSQALNHVPGVAEQADAPAAGRDGGDLNAGSRPATGGAMVVTAVATAWPVVTQAVENSNSALIAASPWPAYLHATVACLVQRESSWNAGAVGAAGEIGWMQIGPANFAYLAGYGITPSMLSDPATNLRAGWIIYLYWQRAIGDGFSAWTTRGGCS